MKNIQKFFLVAALFLFVLSCTKPGLGGDNTVVAFLQHHGKPIFSHSNYCDTVYVKYGATELPGTKAGDYDRIFIGEVGEEHVHIHGLEKGKYFLYAVGFDTTINMRVSGGLAIELKHKTAETEVDVPVTE